MKKFEELPFREYAMYALGASHSKDFEVYKKQFIEMFLSQPERLNPEDASNSVCDSLNSMET